MKGHAIIGFNHGVLGLAENPARGTGFWGQNTEGVARGVLTEKARPEVSFEVGGGENMLLALQYIYSMGGMKTWHQFYNGYSEGLHRKYLFNGAVMPPIKLNCHWSRGIDDKSYSTPTSSIVRIYAFIYC